MWTCFPLELNHKKISGKIFFAIAAIILIGGFLAPNLALAVTGGPNNASAIIDDGSVGSWTWTNPLRAQTSNDSWATNILTSSSGRTHYLKATGFNFTVPTGMTIKGIEVKIEKHQTCADTSCTSIVTDNSVRIVKNGTVTGDEKASATAWPTTDTTVTYGGPTDLWGATWTAANINNNTFGVVLSVERSGGNDRNVFVDNINIIVYYSDTSAPVIASHSDVVSSATVLGGANIDYVVPAATDNVDPAVTVNCLPANNSFFSLGATTVTCNATDAAGNAATPTSFTVTVNPDVVSASVSTATVSNNFVNTSGGITTLIITAKDQYGNPIAGIDSDNIIIAVSGINNTLTRLSTETDGSGVFSAILQSTTPQTKTITVTVNGTELEQKPTVDFYSSSPAKAAITATPLTQEASLTSASITLDLLITDGYDNIVPEGNEVWVLPSSTAPGTLTSSCTQSAKAITSETGHAFCTITFNYKGDVTLKVYSSGLLTSTGDTIIHFTDTIKPVITLTGDSITTVEYRGIYTDAGATALDNIDGDRTSSIVVGGLPIDTSVINVSPINPVDKIVATYTITYNVLDTAGNTATQITRTVNVIDTTSPVVSDITSSATAEGALKIGDSITFTLTPNPAEPIASVSGSYNGHSLSWTTTNSGVSYNAAYIVTSGDADQTAPLQISGVTMTDEAGNTSETTSGTDVAKTIDANRPTVSGVDSDGDVYNKATVSPHTIMITFDEDISNTPLVEVHTIQTSEAVTDCADADAKTFCFDYAIPIKQQRTIHTIFISGAEDMAGNTVLTDSAHTFIVDTLAPDEPIVALPEYINTGNQTALPITGTGEANAIIAYTITDSGAGSVGGAGAVDSDGNINLTADVSSLIDGAVTISLALTDAAGNISEAGTDTATKETVKPELTLLVNADTGNPINGQILKAGSYALRASFSEPVDLPNIAVNYSDAVGACADIATTLMTLPDGGDKTLYTFSFEVNDVCDAALGAITISNATDIPAGNIINANSANTFTVDTLNPEFTATSPATDAFIKADFTVGYTLSEDLQSGSIVFNSPVVNTYVLNSSELTAGAHIISHTSLDSAGISLSEGEHTITFNGIDLAGNDNSLTNSNITYDITSATVINVISDKADNAYKAGENIEITVQFSELVNATYYYQSAGCGYWSWSPCWGESYAYPYITLETGETDRNVNYSSGSGSDTLVFTYTVQPGDNNLDLDYISATALGLNGQTIRDLAGNDADLELSNPGEAGSLGVNKNIIIDTAGPIISVPADITAEATGPGGATVDYIVTATDRDPVSVTSVCSPSSGSTFSLGDTTVNCTAIDALGNTSTSNFTVNVVDTTAPSIEAPEDINQQANGWLSEVDLGEPTASDIVDADLTITNDAPSDGFPVGTTVVTWTATDGAGNSSTATQSVTIFPAPITQLFVTGTSPVVTTHVSTITIYGKDQYGHIATNDTTNPVVVVSVDNGGILTSAMVALSAGQGETELSKISAGTVNVTVSSGSLTPATTQVVFTPADITAPYVDSMSPENNDANVAINAPLFLMFNESVKSETVTSENIKLMKKVGDGEAEIVSAVVSLVEGDRRVNITPSSPLEYAVNYYFLVSDVADKTGNLMDPIISVDNSGFTTAENTADLIAPEAVAQYPGLNSTDATANVTPYLTFSEPLKADTINSANIQLVNYADDTIIPATVSLVEGGTQVNIDPTGDLNYGTQYYFAVSTAVTDEAGNALSAALDNTTKDSHYFTTINVAPVVVEEVEERNNNVQANDQYANGWRYTFKLTVNTDETQMFVRFNDWINSNYATSEDPNNKVAINGNTRLLFNTAGGDIGAGVGGFNNTIIENGYDTVQSYILGNSYDDQKLNPEGGNAAINISGVDDKPTVDGRQIQFDVFTKVPLNTNSGFYSTSYGIKVVNQID